MKELLNALPDDRPVTALCLISDPTKCPADYTVVAKSYDQDLDADLWKDRIFGKHTTRYLCLSKSEVPAGFVIDSLCIINEKDIPPNGYVVLSKTYGSGNLIFVCLTWCWDLYFLFFSHRTKSLEEAAIVLQIGWKEFSISCCNRYNNLKQSKESPGWLYFGWWNQWTCHMLQISSFACWANCITKSFTISNEFETYSFWST